ncbi:Aste57867_7977 [Aphanomyces stellatus]|uniref:Aste57867_7977 protein n=1 Tax=Aphanomyces stellatus TaxID=120398 RepID=A0A485KJ52_9STRA|nr:hypothetical protein As57867_007947 [Aphanomyces stellatus]VFT84870.1 Aste57867_7977 [Aphanomyces stellatus]
MAAEGLNPLSMAFYGEVYFALCGLKGSVVLTGVPIDLSPAFLRDVIVPSGVLSSLAAVVVGPVTTPAFDFAGNIALVNKAHAVGDEGLQIWSTATPLHLTEATGR